MNDKTKTQKPDDIRISPRFLSQHYSAIRFQKSLSETSQEIEPLTAEEKFVAYVETKTTSTEKDNNFPYTTQHLENCSHKNDIQPFKLIKAHVTNIKVEPVSKIKPTLIVTAPSFENSLDQLKALKAVENYFTMKAKDGSRVYRPK